VFQVDAIRWANSHLWWLLLLPVLLVPIWIGYEAWRRRVARSLTGRSLVPSMISGASAWRRATVMIAIFCALELAAIAAMRPRYGLKEISVSGLGIDMAIVFDASRSMKVADLVPDRFTAASVEIGRLLERSKGNRVALVPFAGIAFIQSPLTVDYGVIRQYLADLHVHDLPVPGTNISRALQVAAKALGVDDENPRGSRYKAILLFTDGENHEGDPEAIAEQLAKKNVRIFTIGVGTQNGQPIPILNERGAVTGHVRDTDGMTPVLSKLNEELLRSLASKTGGSYHPLTANQDVATNLAAELEGLEKAEYMARVDRLLEDRFQYPLAGAIFFMIVAFLALGGSKPRKISGVLALLLVFTAQGANAQALLERNHPGVAAAIKQLEAGSFGDAAKALGELTEELPSRPDLWYNLALARSAAKDYPGALEAIEQALTSFDRARELHPSWPTKAKLLHAKGTILALMASSQDSKPAKEVRNTWRQAVEALAQALIADPDSQDTRRNLEIASLVAYPSCKSLDDQYEPNNSPQDAKFLMLDPNTMEFKEELLLCPKDLDFFKLPLNPGETLFASVLAPADESGQEQQGQEQQGPKPADVDLFLHESSTPTKQVRHTAKSDEIVTLMISGPEREDGVSYVLQAQVVPACPQGDDQFEANNTPDAAKVLEDGDISARICPGDDDWFSYVEKKGEQRQVVLEYSNEDGPLELDVLQADGTNMDVTSQDDEQGHRRVVQLPKAEQDASFLIRVYGGGLEGFYKLSISKGDGGGGQNQDDQQEQQPDAGSKTMKEQLDAIDSNSENLEAQEAANQSPYRDHVPDKDW
jgi:Ca-activated chloride channel family protein